jgi:hypothetical protein
MNPLWFVRMAKWLRHPPSKRTLAIWAVVIGLCLLVAGAEALWGWPDWLTVNGRPRLPKP